jgi:hypothetical protein
MAAQGSNVSYRPSDYQVKTLMAIIFAVPRMPLITMNELSEE